MKTTYESFGELANAMCDGGGMLHVQNCPHNDDPEMSCISWQSGVYDFAGWLDHIGVKVSIPDDKEDFYEYVRKNK